MDGEIFELNGHTKFYHGSNFKRVGILNVSDAKQFGVGVYFCTSKEVAEYEFGDYITEVQLSITNPVYTNTEQWYSVAKLAIQNADYDYGKRHNMEFDPEQGYFRYDCEDSSELAEIPSRFISDAAKILGFDAIIDEGSMQYENEICVLYEDKIIYI